MAEYEGKFFQNEIGEYCTFLKLKDFYYEATVCLEHGPRQNIHRKLNEKSIENLIMNEKLRAIQDENSQRKVIDFMEQKKEEGKYRLFWSSFESIQF